MTTKRYGFSVYSLLYKKEQDIENELREKMSNLTPRIPLHVPSVSGNRMKDAMLALWCKRKGERDQTRLEIDCWFLWSRIKNSDNLISRFFEDIP